MKLMQEPGRFYELLELKCAGDVHLRYAQMI